jgi:hypothetical protein
MLFIEVHTLSLRQPVKEFLQNIERDGPNIALSKSHSMNSAGFKDTIDSSVGFIPLCTLLHPGLYLSVVALPDGLRQSAKMTKQSVSANPARRATWAKASNLSFSRSSR